jgi:HSP20 family protein
VVRFELPGLYPATDLDIAVEAQSLTVHAERRPAGPGSGHAEFRYGTFANQVTLPAHTDDNDVTATYDHGILACCAW